MAANVNLETLLLDLAMQGVELHVNEGALHYKAPPATLDTRKLELLRRFKAEIIQVLIQQDAVAHSEPVHVVSRPRTAPLTTRQRDFWSNTCRNPEPWITYSAARYSGALDCDALTASIALLIERHEALRTRIVDRCGSPVQLIEAAAHPYIEIHDLRLSAQEREAVAHNLVREFMYRRISRESGPLFRVCVLHLGDNEHIVAIVLDHILSDARSIAVVRAEFWDAYFAFSHGRRPSLPAVPLQFADYAVWEEHTLHSRLRKHLPFWLAYLSEAKVLSLPIDLHRTTTRGLFASGELTQLCDPETTLILRNLAKRLSTTLPMLVLAGCVATLQRWTGQNDLVIRRTISARTSVRLASTVGFLLNHALLRVQVAGDVAFAELLDRVKTCVIDSQEPATVPLNSVLSALHRNDASRLAETFSFNYLPHDMVQSYQAPPEQPSASSAITQYRVKDDGEEAFVEIMCAVIETSDRLMARVRYAKDLFHPGTTRHFMASFSRLLKQVAFDPNVSVADTSDNYSTPTS